MPQCRVVTEHHESRLLAGNPLGDPAERELVVVLPPGYETETHRSYPVVFVLAGFFGGARSHLNWKIFEESLPERISRLTEEGMPPAIFALPDGSTRLGGSQYRNSAAQGPYADYITEELVPFVDERYRTLEGRRGIVGKSSGGYGALMLGMERPDLFGAVACHSGDCLFEYCYRTDFPRAVNRLVKAGGVEAFVEELEGMKKRSSDDMHVLMTVAMAACYSPDPEEPLGLALPFRLPTGEIREEIWSRWLEHDPVHAVEDHAEALRGLDWLFLDCGDHDQYHLHLGMRLLGERLEALGVEHEMEEFDDDHSGISYRYDASLPKMVRVLTGVES